MPLDNRHSLIPLLDDQWEPIPIQLAALELGVAEGTLQQRLWRWRKQNSHAAHVTLNDLRVSHNVLIVKPVTHQGRTWDMPIVDLMKLCGVSRYVVEKRISEFCPRFAEPMELKEFLRYVLQDREGRGRRPKRNRRVE